MTPSGFSPTRLARLGDVLKRHVGAGHVPGALALVARRGEVHVVATGRLAFEGEGSGTPMAGDTVVRVTSWTKQLVAACAMTLVEDGTLRLDDPVDGFLPELAGMRVLADPAGPLDDTVAAERPTTLRDLLTCRLGTGAILAEPGAVPLADALNALELADRPGGQLLSPDEWIRRLGALPLAHQPGERWMYHISPIVLGVLVARAAGRPLGEALRERICEPLGMKDTGIGIDAGSAARLATAYTHDEATGALAVEHGPDWLRHRLPVFKTGGSGLVTTADDFLAFTSALLAGGIHRGERVLSPQSVALMTTDHLTRRQREASTLVWTPVFQQHFGWGFGMAVNLRRNHLAPSVGSYGWYGKYGTGWFNDPARDLTAMLVTQSTATFRHRVFPQVWAAAYRALDD
ncbi:serine hydrolase domain-containing protein [Kitasatospora viridis]|uniref:CubicO group peptidase (Beta-lactamase class C family) n=1 Tax=Kitasatospora viridis TaxID=281105 RepID=A0A561SG47_9ACTN|nr:serine hydrolase domain-containing protein [Kitasatospora viridis]TWF73818.1 CubicO group peptidase (beta-lactamase class C family) [Kitasatospora viridis]